MVIGQPEDVAQVRAAVFKLHPHNYCGCPCHEGKSGFWHCWNSCCDLEGILYPGFGRRFLEPNITLKGVNVLAFALSVLSILHAFVRGGTIPPS